MAEKKILIVDYDNRSLEALAEILNFPRTKILKASDGQQAYDMFQAENPDCVVMEAFLPKIHGFDLARRINQESKGRLPVVIVTGLYRGPQYRHEALSVLGASEYFEKPVNPEQFRAAIRKMLRDDEDLDVDLPDADDVIASLTRRMRSGSKAATGKEETSPDTRPAKKPSKSEE